MPIGRLSRRGLDNAADAAERMLSDAMVHAAVHVVAVGRTALAVDGDHLANAIGSDLTGRVLVWLGNDERGEPWVAAVGYSGDESGFIWADARTLTASLDPDEAQVALQALALSTWHADHEFSPKDGSPTQVAHAGWSRIDEQGREHFPRTDPAVIVAIFDRSGERILLANNAAWPATRYSLIAGFVDPGESLERCVAREALEEVGLEPRSIQYVASQPWPYPRSLMIGFIARMQDDAEPTPDGVEIRDARWLSKSDLKANEVDLPGSGSIARRIIDAWLAGEIVPPAV